jgi:hypothetical protein
LQQRDVEALRILPAAADMTMIVPIPSPVADAVIKRVGDANINTQTADMRACAGTPRSGAGTRAHATDLDAGANLSVCRAREQNHDRKYRSRQRFHSHIPQVRKERLCN